MKKIFSLVLFVLMLSVFYIANSKDQDVRLLENPNWVYPTVATTTVHNKELPMVIANPNDKPPENYIKYTNEKYGFYYYHSPESKITEYDEGGGAMTVVQENTSKMRGLQIFIIPYDKSIITEEQFNKDIPSGVRYNIANTTVGKKRIPAVTFNSQDSFLGETREVWFIYDGHLYEITTFKGFGDWFGPIMQTWRFL